MQILADRHNFHSLKYMNMHNTGCYSIIIDCLCRRLRFQAVLFFIPFLQDPAHSLLVNQKYILLDYKQLEPHVHYTVDVQAKFCDWNTYRGPWSEWSSTAEWRTRGPSAEIEGRTAFMVQRGAMMIESAFVSF